MAKSKNRIAQEMYGEDFENLYGGQKAAVTRAYDRKATATKKTVSRPAKKEGFVEVGYGRPGNNGIKSGFIAEGATHEKALSQIGIYLNMSKEGIMAKKVSGISTGTVVKVNETVKEGLYMICPGIDSSL